MVPGRVYPGVEISIGRAFMMVERIYDEIRNSAFAIMTLLSNPCRKGRKPSESGKLDLRAC